LSDIVDTLHSNYSEVDGELTEMDESHQINRHVLTGPCEAVIVLETSLPLSLTLVSQEDETPMNSVRGVGFAVLPAVHLPGEKEPLRLIIRGISSELTIGFTWKLRIFSTGPVNCREDTAPADKTAAAIAAWEKKRGVVKPSGAKKADAKRGAAVEPPVTIVAPVIDQSILERVDGEGVVLTDAQIEALLPGAAQPTEEKPGPSEPAVESGEELRDQISALAGRLGETWDQYEARMAQVTKLFTPTPPKIEEK
jgi:hypothetical protein